MLFGSLPQRTMSFSIIFRCDLASPGCLAGGTCTSEGRWWSQSTSLQSGGLAWASGITRRQGANFVVERLMIKHGSFQGSKRLLWATKAVKHQLIQFPMVVSKYHVEMGSSFSALVRQWACSISPSVAQHLLGKLEAPNSLSGRSSTLECCRQIIPIFAYLQR